MLVIFSPYSSRGSPTENRPIPSPILQLRPNPQTSELVCYSGGQRLLNLAGLEAESRTITIHAAAEIRFEVLSILIADPAQRFDEVAILVEPE